MCIQLYTIIYVYDVSSDTQVLRYKVQTNVIFILPQFLYSFCLTVKTLFDIFYLVLLLCFKLALRVE